MNKPNRCSAIGGLAAGRVIVLCAGLVAAIGTAAHAQSPKGVASPPSPGVTATPSSSNPSVLAFSEDFKSPTSYKERFDSGWSGEWNAGSMWGGNRNDWHADHGMKCENPNTSHRTIHLTSQQQAIEAAFY